MGIHGLTKAIKKMSPTGIQQIPIQDLREHLGGKSRLTVLGVDVYSYLYPAQYNAGAKGRGNHIRIFMDLICNFWAAGLSLIFVFDGNTYSDAKKETIDARTARRAETQQSIVSMVSKIAGVSTEEVEDTDVALEQGALVTPIDPKALGTQLLRSGLGTAEEREALQKLMKRSINITSQDIQDLVTLFDLVGAPYLQAQGEADFLLASLYEDGHIGAVLSEDKDMLTHGIGHLVSGLIDPECRQAASVMLYNLKTILTESQLTNPLFVDFCILLGCDYCSKIDGVAEAKGLALLKKYGNISGILTAIRSGKVKHQPKGQTLDSYEESYERAYKIFTTRQEATPEGLRLSGGYHPQPELKAWLLERTNYTGPTVTKKIEGLTEAAKPTNVPELEVHAPKPKPVLKPKPKPTVIATEATTSKTKIKVKPKSRSPVQEQD